MTAIAGVGFHDCMIVLSDSRVSFEDNRRPAIDRLKKLYQLSPHLMLGYTTNNVIATHSLIEQLTIYATSQPNADSKVLARKFIDKAIDIYNEVIRINHNTPLIELLFMGITMTEGKEKRTKLVKAISHFGSHPFFPAKIKQLDLQTIRQYVKLPPPNCFISRLRLPQGQVKSCVSWDVMGAAGSGYSVLAEIEKNWRKLLFVPKPFDRAIILQYIFEDYFAKMGDTSVGGSAQTFIIDEKGVNPLTFSISSNGTETHRVEMDDSGTWIITDKKTNRSVTIVQNPLKK